MGEDHRVHARGRLLSVLIAAVLAAATVGTSTRTEAGSTTSSERTGFRGYLLDRGRYKGFDAKDPAVQLFPGGINDFGVITGEYLRTDSESGLLRDGRGRITFFDVPGARGTEATKINNRGRIVVHYSNDTGFVNDSADMRTGILYRGKVTPIAFPGAANTVALGINNSGAIVGAYYNSLPASATPMQPTLRSP